MKWILAPLLWLLAGTIAALVLYRFWRGQNVLLRGQVSPRVIRVVVLVLVMLGIGVEKVSSHQAAAPSKDVTQKENQGPETPAALDAELVNRWLLWTADHSDGMRASDEQWRQFKQVFVRLEIELAARKRATPEQIVKLVRDLDAEEFAVRQAAFELLWDLGPAARSALKAALEEKPGLDKAMRIEKLLARHAETVKQAREHLKYVPQPIKPMVSADLEALDGGKPVAPTSSEALMKTIATIEAQGLLDPWLSAYLWRKAGLVSDDKQTPVLMARLQQYVRLTHTLVLARQEAAPLFRMPRAWMSKAGPSLEDRRAIQKAVNDVLAAARRLYPTSDLGTWEKDAVALLTVANGSPEPRLLRGGREFPVGAGRSIRFNRLDMIVAPAGDKPVVLEHEYFGNLTLPAGTTATVWDLPRFLADAARKDIKDAVAASLEGDEKATVRIERSLPLVQQLLRAALIEKPKSTAARPGCGRSLRCSMMR